MSEAPDGVLLVRTFRDFLRKLHDAQAKKRRLQQGEKEPKDPAQDPEHGKNGEDNTGPERDADGFHRFFTHITFRAIAEIFQVDVILAGKRFGRFSSFHFDML
ncbi:MAG: hypothetical protein V4710_16660 [Verrucomicrobiota bacterium]